MLAQRTLRCRAGAALTALVLIITSVQIARAECQQCVGAPCCPKTEAPHQELRSLPPCCVVSAAAPAIPRPPASPAPSQFLALVSEGPILFTAQLPTLTARFDCTARDVAGQDLYQRKCSYLL